MSLRKSIEMKVRRAEWLARTVSIILEHLQCLITESHWIDRLQKNHRVLSRGSLLPKQLKQIKQADNACEVRTSQRLNGLMYSFHLGMSKVKLSSGTGRRRMLTFKGPADAFRNDRSDLLSAELLRVRWAAI